MRLGAVRQHGPDLARAAAGGFENEVAAVRGPAGALIAALVAGQLDELLRGGVHDVNVVVVVGPAPTESQQLTVRRPGWIDDVALVGQVEFGRAGAVGIHEVELWSAATIADK